MSSPTLKARQSSETPKDPRHSCPSFGEQLRNVLQLLLLIGVVFWALWWIERAVT